MLAPALAGPRIGWHRLHRVLNLWGCVYRVGLKLGEHATDLDIPARPRSRQAGSVGITTLSGYDA